MQRQRSVNSRGESAREVEPGNVKKTNAHETTDAKEVANDLPGGFDGAWGQGCMETSHRGDLLCDIQMQNALFVLPVRLIHVVMAEGTLAAFNAEVNHPVWVWQARLSHPSIENMRILLRNPRGLSLEAKVIASRYLLLSTKFDHKDQEVQDRTTMVASGFQQKEYPC